MFKCDSIPDGVDPEYICECGWWGWEDELAAFEDSDEYIYCPMCGQQL